MPRYERTQVRCPSPGGCDEVLNSFVEVAVPSCRDRENASVFDQAVESIVKILGKPADAADLRAAGRKKIWSDSLRLPDVGAAERREQDDKRSRRERADAIPCGLERAQHHHSAVM